MCPSHLVLHHRIVGPLVPGLGRLVHPEDLRLPVPDQAEHTRHYPLIPVIQQLALNFKLLKDSLAAVDLKLSFQELVQDHLPITCGVPRHGSGLDSCLATYLPMVVQGLSQ